MEARISEHAVARFRERMRDVPDDEARRLIHESLQSIVGAKKSENTGSVTVTTQTPIAMRVVLVQAESESLPPVVATVMHSSKGESPSDCRHKMKSRVKLLLKNNSGMIPLRITAFTPRGFCSSDPMSPSIDGILAYWHLRDVLGEEAVAVDGASSANLAPVDGLPLAKEMFIDDWWYCCSSPTFTKNAQIRRHYHRRFDDRLACDWTVASKVTTSTGPYKPSRLSENITLSPHVTWHVIGIKEEISRLLQSCTHIGRGPARGYGEVSEWRIEEDGNANAACFLRPLPVKYASRFALEGRKLLWGIRPPGRIPQNIRECIIPVDCNDTCGA